MHDGEFITGVWNELNFAVKSVSPPTVARKNQDGNATTGDTGGVEAVIQGRRQTISEAVVTMIDDANSRAFYQYCGGEAKTAPVVVDDIVLTFQQEDGTPLVNTIADMCVTSVKPSTIGVDSADPALLDVTFKLHAPTGGTQISFA